MIARICQELGIAPTTDLDAILSHIRVLKGNFAQQVAEMQSGHMPKGQIINGDTIKMGIEGRGIPIIGQG